MNFLACQQEIFYNDTVINGEVRKCDVVLRVFQPFPIQRCFYACCSGIIKH